MRKRRWLERASRYSPDDNQKANLRLAIGAFLRVLRDLRV